MPFGPSVFPALGLSLVKPLLAAAGFTVRTHYATLAFADLIGAARYDEIATARPNDLVGDWIFSGALAPAPGPERYAEMLRASYAPAFAGAVVDARSKAPDFLADVVAGVLATEPRLVGFTSTFAQHAASLAAAKAIKALRPDLPIVFGGANCEGEMGIELVRRFPFVDAVVSGEGEGVVVELARRLIAKRFAGDLPGVVTASGLARSQAVGAAPPAVTELDALPLPDFDEYYASLDAIDPRRETYPRCLMVEASRGCWWGAKHHCTFCGLNGAQMGFRSKSPERFIDELRRLSARYGITNISTADNILDYKYFSTVLPALAERELGLTLFFEIKANLRREHVELLRAAGVDRVQPGIESLDSGVLALMRKGVSALQNVQTLKLCKEYGINVVWNLLYGFPNEDRDAYARMAALFPLLAHLPPPDSAGAIRMDRFSPFFEDPAAFGMTNVRPSPAYAEVYGGPPESLHRLAYYFEFDYADGRDAATYTQDTAAAVRRWRDDHDRSDLCTMDGGTELLLVDRRPVARNPMVLLAGLERTIYLACDEIAGARTVIGAAANAHPAVPADDVLAACRRFVADGMMLEEDGKYLSLAVSLERGGASRELQERLVSAQR